MPALATELAVPAVAGGETHEVRVSWTLRDWAAIGVLGMLAAAFFAPLLVGDRAAFFGDIIMGFYPVHDLWREYVLRGDLPTWNPYILNGFPTFADAEHSTFYPSLLLNLVLPLHRAYAWDLLLHVFLLSALTYLFLRRRPLPAVPAAFGAMVFALGGFVAVRVTQLNLLRTLAWFPLVLLLVEVQVDPARRSRRLTAALAAVFAAQLLAGHLQTILITGLLATAYGLWLIRGRGGAAREGLGLLAVLTLAAAFAAALAAPQLVPNAELARHIDRSGANAEFATTFALPIRQLPMLVLPHLFGNPADGQYLGPWLYWEMVAYAGVIPVMLAAVGLLWSRHPVRGFWAAAAAVGVVLALGNATPVYRLAYRLIPGLAFFRVPARFLVYYAWAVAVLSAYGLHWLLTGAPAGRRRRAVGAFAIVLAVAALHVATAWPGAAASLAELARRTLAAPQNPFAMPAEEGVPYLVEMGVESARSFGLLWVAGLALILGARAGRVGPATAVTLLGLLTAGDLFSFGAAVYPAAPAGELRRPTEVGRSLDLGGEKYRILTTPAYTSLIWTPRMTLSFAPMQEPDGLYRYRSAFVPNIPILDRVANVSGYNPILPARGQEVLAAAIADAQRHEGRSSLLDFMGARYIFSFADIPHTYRQVYRAGHVDGGYRVWFNEAALPRGYLVTDIQMRSDQSVAAALPGPEWDPSRTVVLHERAVEAETFGLRPVPVTGRITRRIYEPARVAFDLALPHPAVLVLSDADYPGWRAMVDGVERRIYRANYAFRALLLPAGTRHVEFVYRPRSLVAGLLVGAHAWLALGLIMGAAVLGGRRRRDAR